MDHRTNLQEGQAGEVLPRPLCVRAEPGAEIEFFSPDLGTFVGSGTDRARVVADGEGVARVRLRLGEGTGRYTVIACRADAPGPKLLFNFRALVPPAAGSSGGPVGVSTDREGGR